MQPPGPGDATSGRPPGGGSSAAGGGTTRTGVGGSSSSGSGNKIKNPHPIMSTISFPQQMKQPPLLLPIPSAHETALRQNPNPNYQHGGATSSTAVFHQRTSQRAGIVLEFDSI
ncbi:unnamed protein product [Amoebophrya sp. A120]|nr:unnamed protein product [Amoebophrya sp. A120]|eukprot:GSA120T00009158001.1